ncbi:MAG: hypothetical protein PHH57_08825, partial [Candidatus Omnitrophica bacterium]|nr:hypothetical protein [Candidatus Omnitrophota bacterium]
KTATAAERLVEESRDFAEQPRLSAKKLALAETEQKALDRLNKGIEDVQNFLQHKDIYAVYPPGTTIEAALVDIKAKTGVDLLKLVADVEAAQARGGLRQQIAGEAKFSRLGQAAGAIPQPSKLTGISQERTIGRLPKPTPMVAGKAIPEEKLLGKGSISAAKLRIPGKMEPVGEGQKVRSLGVSVMRSPETPSEVRAGLLMEAYPGESGVYTAITNKATIDEAKKMISSSVKQAERFAKENPGTALSNTIHLELVKKANLEGRFDDAIDLIQEVSGRSTTQGQAIQSLRLWGKMTPEGMQKFYVDTIDKVNKEIANAAKKVKLSDDIMAKIKANMDEVAKLPEGRDKDLLVARTLDTIASQVPVPFLRKVASIHTMAQLLNPKTAIRNILGNVGFMGMENVSGVVGAAVDRPLSLLTGKRTKVLPSLTAQLKGFKQGWKHGLEDALLGIDTSAMATKFDLPKGRVFRKGALGFAEKVLNIELRATDRAFYQAAYEDSLLNQLRAAKVNVPTEEMKNIAHLDGLYRTFQDENALSKLFIGIKQTLNKLTGSKEFGVGDFIVKYPRTPANLLARGLDYSPAGFVRVILEAARPLAGKEFNQKAFVESFSRGLTGSTALFGVGALLHRLGIITGGPPEDRDLAELQRQQGFGEYRINTSALKRLVFGNGDTKTQKGDKIVSYDWFQPQAMPVAIGADVDANKGTGRGIVGTLIEALFEGINAFAEQPVVQGIKTLFSGGYGDWSKGVVKVLETIPSSFIPTFLSQIRQLMDNQRRETYSPDKGQEAFNRVFAKIPGLAAKLPPKYGTLGHPLETYIGGGNKPFNVFLNPAFVNTYAPSPEVQRVFDLYSQTGEVKQVPRVADKSITVSGKRFTLSGQEYSEYQRLLGEYTRQGFEKMPKNLKPEDAVKRMQEIMTDANTRARAEILKARGLNVYKKGSGIAVK